MKISFILPCYNVEKYIKRCIESIIAIRERDIEIIAINDGSTDSTLQILESLQSKYEITIINYDEPSGFAGRPRNAGINIAQGEYLSFIDPDDYFLGDKIIESYNLYHGYDIIINSFHICNPKGRIIDKVILKNKDVDRCKFLWRQIVNVCNQRTLYKREFIEKNKVRFYEDCPAEDLNFLYASYVAGARIRTTNLVTTMYLDNREDSVTNVINSKYIEASILGYEHFFNVINNSLCEREVNSAIGEHFLGYYLKVRRSLSSHQKELIRSTNFYEYIKTEITG